MQQSLHHRLQNSAFKIISLNDLFLSDIQDNKNSLYQTEYLMHFLLNFLNPINRLILMAVSTKSEVNLIQKGIYNSCMKIFVLGFILSENNVA